MKVTLDRNTWRVALEKARTVVGNSASMRITADRPSMVRLTAYTPNAIAETVIGAIVETVGQAAFPLGWGIQATDTLPTGNMIVENIDNETVLTSSGKRVTLSQKANPPPEPVPEAGWWKISGKSFRQAVNTAILGVSNRHHPAFAGLRNVRFATNNNDNTLRVFAGNGQLTVTQLIPMEPVRIHEPPAELGTWGLTPQALKKTLSILGKPGEYHLHRTEHYAWITNSAHIAVGTTPDTGPYPHSHSRDLFNAEYPWHATLPRVDTIWAIRQQAALAPPKPPHDHTITVQLSPTETLIGPHRRPRQVAATQQHLPPQPITMTFHTDALTRCLSSFTGDLVTMRFQHSNPHTSPVKIVAPANPQQTHYQIPCWE